MSHREEMFGEMNDVESLLADFAPADTSVDRDRIMFEAGRAAALRETPRGPSTIGWRIACSGLAATVCALAAWLAVVHSQGPTVKRQVVYVPVRQPETMPTKITASSESDGTDELELADGSIAWSDSPTFASPSGEYLRQRNLALARGIDALPAVRVSIGASTPQPPPTVSNLLDEFL